MDGSVCSYCGEETDEPVNRFGTHDYCIYENDTQEEER